MFANGYDPYNTADLFRRKRLEDTLRVAMTVPPPWLLRGYQPWRPTRDPLPPLQPWRPIRNPLPPPRYPSGKPAYDGIGKPPFDMDY